jgi:uncharacterized RDD family membrane protein YckC
MQETDPYRPPQVRVDDPLPESGSLALASRRDRFFAASLDGVLYLGTFLLVSTMSLSVGTEFGTAPFLLSLLILMVLFAVNLYLLYAGGQTIGKKLLKIKIVLKDGARAGLGRIFLLRMLVPGVIGFVPYLGWLFGIIDSLCIFNADHRCIHDHIAGTVVIRV